MILKRDILKIDTFKNTSLKKGGGMVNVPLVSANLYQNDFACS